MKPIHSLITLLLISLFSVAVGKTDMHSCFTSKDDISVTIDLSQRSKIPFDSTMMAPFYQKFPELAKYETEVKAVYRKYNFMSIWLAEKGIVEFGHSLYSKVKALEVEGVPSTFPYQAKLDGVFDDEIENTLTDTETELMLTNLFVFYTGKVYHGIDEKTTTEIGWLLPRKQLSYTVLLDSILTNSSLSNDEGKYVLRQYYKLKAVLQQYREIEKKGGWIPIETDPKIKAYKPGDSAKAILQIRDRLFITHDLKQNNGSSKYDVELMTAVKKYLARNGFKPTTTITQAHIKQMNQPIGDRIRQIVVNMERCRWISPDLISARELVVVNIPSYKLNFYRMGKSVLESPVVVGSSKTKTVIFAGKMSYIAFSPYWNVPQSIINKEVKPGMAKNPNYLAAHNMEWNNGQVRQLPGKRNSLGLVKFMFPNAQNIYLHDTPSKSLFERESRAFSHGCIRVQKPRELAITILEGDKNWTPAKIDAAMNAGKESVYTLKEKIPVYIGYFTVWVSDGGEINFYDDVYKRDENLYQLLVGK